MEMQIFIQTIIEDCDEDTKELLEDLMLEMSELH